MKNNTRPEAPKSEAAGFTKEQFLRSPAWAGERDLLSAVLQDGKSYTKEEAGQLADSYKKRKV